MATQDFSGSDTGHINAVSMPTYYINTVLIDGVPYLINGKGELSSSDDPDVILTKEDGTPFTADDARSAGSEVSESFSDVSWRTPFGAKMQFPHGGAAFVNALKEAAPEVNTIRVDFNAATLKNDAAMARFKEIATAAADNDMQLIIQYSDGAMAGRSTADEEAYPSRTPDPSGRMEEIGHEWAEVMEWFELPENKAILDSVYGWEIINEPMAYSNDAEGGQAYADDITSIVKDYGIDWHDKKILVGGLRASAQFEHINVDQIRAVIGDDLVWSMHLYPGWANENNPTFNNDKFMNEMEKRISNIIGDDILLTEMHLGNTDVNENGKADLFDVDAGEGDATGFNAARMYQFFVDNGIGITYWPPIARKSSFLTNEGKGQFGVSLPQLAFANDLWSRDSSPEEHASDEEITAVKSSSLFSDDNSFAEAYGYDGDDVLTGLDDTVNMLYGGDGDDLLIAGSQGDYLFGQDGYDDLVGGDGNDSLIGGTGSNSFTGGAGDDWIEARGELDEVDAGDGNDTIVSSNSNTILTGDGQDVILPTGEGEGSLFVGDMEDEDILDMSMWAGDANKSGEILIQKIVITEEGKGSDGVRITSSVDPALNLIVRWAGEDVADFPIVGIDDGMGVSEKVDENGLPVYNVEDGTTQEPVREVTEPEPEDGDGDEDDGETDGETDNGTDDGETDNGTDDNEDDEEGEQDGSSGGGGGCFVATAAYGDRMNPQVIALRRFRDDHLIKHKAGRAFVKFYWKVGPVMAEKVSSNGYTGRLIRSGLDKLVTSLRRRNLTSGR